MDWSELEPLYRLDKHAYDLKLNFNVSLEDWDNFDGTVDRMFALLGNFNHQPNGHRSNLIPGEGRGGRDQALVSSTDQSASAIYLTTLATPALLLREAGAEVLREALGLNGGAHRSPSSSSSSCPPVPAEEGRSDWDRSPPLLNQLGDEGRPSQHEEGRERGDEEEEELLRRRSAQWRLNHVHCHSSTSRLIWGRACPFNPDCSSPVPQPYPRQTAPCWPLPVIHHNTTGLTRRFFMRERSST
ncbi:hypothetical protein J4Q44_G00263580 [Coregonus suidteri]|uniref:Uncharacterized protein n=1 Tax=Coregonus suidteri TaxID=861788 RepID=A0AAN8QFN2_9TELE